MWGIFHVVNSNVNSHWKDLCTQCARAIKINHIIHTTRLYFNHFYVFNISWCLVVIGPIEPIKKNKSLMFWTFWRIEEYFNRMVNRISKIFCAMKLGVETSKLHVWACFHHVKSIAERNIAYNSNKEVKDPGMGSDPFCQDFLIVVWLSSYIFYRGPMG